MQEAGPEGAGADTGLDEKVWGLGGGLLAGLEGLPKNRLKNPN